MLKDQTNEFYLNRAFKYVFLFMVFALLMVLFASRAYAGFNLKYDLDEHDVYTIPYFSFQHWPAWVDAGGYLEVTFIPEGGGDRVDLRIEASQGKFYPQYNGTWTFRPKLANGEQAGSTSQFQFLITGQEPYDGGFDKYQDLDPNKKEQWDGASPINDNKNYDKPSPTGGGNNDGGNGGDNGGGNNDGGNGGDNGGGNNGGGTGGCSCFKTQEWQDLMDTLNDIKDNIPPPPKWDEVSETFKDKIVPSMTNSMENMLKDEIVPTLTDSLRDMLGTAPDPPSVPDELDITPPTPPTQPSVHDYAGELELDEPGFDDVPGLDEASRAFDNMKNQAPEIQFNDDPTGGFNIVNPLDSLPKLPYDGFPMPGQNAGAWDHQPQQSTNFTPPTPGGGTNFEPPIPNTGNVQPPTGSHDEFGWGYYKPHPDAPDGSGGGW